MVQIERSNLKRHNSITPAKSDGESARENADLKEWADGSSGDDDVIVVVVQVFGEPIIVVNRGLL